MQSNYLARSLFGCTRISLISAALFVWTILFPVTGAVQQSGNSQEPGSTLSWRIRDDRSHFSAAGWCWRMVSWSGSWVRHFCFDAITSLE
jgi:hypothetical protein